jgi:uncharacterized protein
MNRNEILSFLSDFKRQHADRYGIISLGIFGSMARGEVRYDSDIDIYVRTKTPDPFLLVHIKDDIEKHFQRRVDIVRLRDNMNPFFKRRIEQEGIDV